MLMQNRFTQIPTTLYTPDRFTMNERDVTVWRHLIFYVKRFLAQWTAIRYNKGIRNGTFHIEREE